MKERIFSIGLFIFELSFYICLIYIYDFSIGVSVRMGLIWFLFATIFKHYKIQSTLIWSEINNMARVYFYFFLFTVLFMYPGVLVIQILIIGFLMFVFSILMNRTLRILFRNLVVRKTIVIGTGSDAYRIGMISNNNRFALTQIKGFIKLSNMEVFDDLKNSTKFDVYDINQLDNILEKFQIDQIIIAIPESSKTILDEISQKIYDKVKIVKIVPKLDFTMTFDSEINDFDGILMISTSHGKIGKLQRFIKRVVDIFVGLFGCALCGPLSIYVKCMNLKNGDRDPIFFKQKRIGLNGETIEIFKFRSMIPNAEQVLEDMMKNDPLIKQEYLQNKKLINDPRITKAGHFLRKTSLDEFPQFWNVLKGEMSFVGPRPYLPREMEDMGIYFNSIIQCKPGITGMWQANGRSDVGFAERCKFDDYYYRNWNIGLDMIIIYKTIKSLLYGKGAL